MWLDFYMFLTLASGIALAVLGWQLCSIHIPHREDTHRLRTARAILAASYFNPEVKPADDLMQLKSRLNVARLRPV